MVLVQSYPSAARVTYNGHFFGYTPTYVHVPGLTQVSIDIERNGWKPVTETFTSQHPGMRLTVQLEHVGGAAASQLHYAATRSSSKNEGFERPPI